MIVYARYWKATDLSQAWRKSSPGYIVDIRNVKSGRLAHYLTKYLTKADAPYALQLAMSDALHGSRLFFTFGAFYHDERQVPKSKPICPECGATSFVILEFAMRQFYDRVVAAVHGPPNRNPSVTPQWTPAELAILPF
jgi:hypothetical protein